MQVVCWRCASHKARCSYTLPAPEIGALVGRLVQAPPVPSVAVDAETATRLATEVQITAENGVFEKGIMQLGVLTPFTCSECHGGFRRIAEGQMSQFRCHTGHAWTSDNGIYVNHAPWAT